MYAQRCCWTTDRMNVPTFAVRPDMRGRHYVSRLPPSPPIWEVSRAGATRAGIRRSRCGDRMIWWTDGKRASPSSLCPSHAEARISGAGGADSVPEPACHGLTNSFATSSSIVILSARQGRAARRDGARADVSGLAEWIASTRTGR